MEYLMHFGLWVGMDLGGTRVEIGSSSNEASNWSLFLRNGEISNPTNLSARIATNTASSKSYFVAIILHLTMDFGVKKPQ
jgi:hypothetical protein